MSKFVVVIFPDGTNISQGTKALKDLHAKGNIKIYASAVVARDSGGTLSVQEITKEGTRRDRRRRFDRWVGRFAGWPACDDDRRCGRRLNRKFG